LIYELKESLKRAEMDIKKAEADLERCRRRESFLWHILFIVVVVAVYFHFQCSK